MLLNNDALRDLFTFLPRQEVDTNIIVTRQFRDIIAENAHALPLRNVSVVVLREATVVGDSAHDVQEGLLGLSVGENPDDAVIGEGDSKTVDHLTIVSGLADNEQGGVRRYFHIDGIRSTAELFALFGVYAKNSYAGFYVTLNFAGEASKKEWNEFFATLRTMNVDTLVMENDFVPPPPELFLKFASASIRCLSVFSSKLSTAHLTNDLLKNAHRNGMTSIQFRRGPIDGGFYAVEEDAVLAYCFPKDGPLVEGRNVRLVQLRLGKTFLLNAVEASKVGGTSKESAFYLSPILLSEQEGYGKKQPSEDGDVTVYEDDRVVVSVFKSGKDNATLVVRAKKE